MNGDIPGKGQWDTQSCDWKISWLTLFLLHYNYSLTHISHLSKIRLLKDDFDSKACRASGIHLCVSFLLMPPALLLHFFPDCDSKCCWESKKASDQDQGHIILNFYFLTSLLCDFSLIRREKELSKITKGEL